MNATTPYLRTIKKEFSSLDSVADGDYEFKLSAINQTNILEYFLFVDVDGNIVSALAGTVDITMSPGKDFFQTIFDGSFDAIDADNINRTKPSGLGYAEKIKITLAGITGDPVGFVCLLTQSAG